ncbi:hypothetical protein MKW98_031879, partial [Papaver atlanticum]
NPLTSTSPHHFFFWNSPLSETASKCSSSFQTLSVVITMRKRGGLSQRSSGQVDPLHNSVPERSPIARQKPSTNVTLGRARRGLSKISGPTNGWKLILKGEKQQVYME